MCLPKNKAAQAPVTAPAPAPAPPAPSAAVAQSDPQNDENTESLAERAKRRGTSSLRIPLSTGGSGGGTGLNIPQG